MNYLEALLDVKSQLESNEGELRHGICTSTVTLDGEEVWLDEWEEFIPALARWPEHSGNKYFPIYLPEESGSPRDQYYSRPCGYIEKRKELLEWLIADAKEMSNEA